jgi:V8-like Glu-specific endopeptidase
VAQVRAYWTEQRMLAATPLDGLVGSVAPTRSTDRAASGQAVQSNSSVRVPRTVGKLFFSDSGADYVCSAAAIRTQKRNKVLTAGHCVHTGPHPEDGLLPGLCLLVCPAPHYFSNWMFVPRYENGAAPYGKWVATRGVVSDGWRTHENFTQDQGVLSMARRNGKRLVDVIGGNRVALNQSARQAGVRIWGWPAETPYDGETAWRCDGATVRDDSYWKGDAEMSCSMTAGSSGGPWILPGNRTANVGTIFAVTSRGTTAGPQILLAHPLPGELRTLIATAGG